MVLQSPWHTFAKAFEKPVSFYSILFSLSLFLLCVCVCVCVLVFSSLQHARPKFMHLCSLSLSCCTFVTFPSHNNCFTQQGWYHRVISPAPDGNAGNNHGTPHQLVLAVNFWWKSNFDLLLEEESKDHTQTGMDIYYTRRLMEGLVKKEMDRMINEYEYHDSNCSRLKVLNLSLSLSVCVCVGIIWRLTHWIPL